MISIVKYITLPTLVIYDCSTTHYNPLCMFSQTIMNVKLIMEAVNSSVETLMETITVSVMRATH